MENAEAKNILPLRRDKKLLAGVLVLASAAAAGYAGLFYVISEKGRSISSLSQEIERDVVREQELRTLAEVVRSTKDDREALEQHFLRSEDAVASFIGGVEELGSEVGVAVAFDAVGIGSAAEEREELKLSFTASGDFEDVFYFFSLFELLPYSFSFEKIFLEEGRRREDEAGWKGSFAVALLSFTRAEQE